MKKSWWKVPVALAGVLMAGIYPLMFLWMVNYIQVSDVSRILRTLAVLCAGSAGLWLLLLLAYRDVYKAALGSIAAILIFENGAVLQDLLTMVMPALRYWHTATLLGILMILCWLAIIKLNKGAIDIAAPIAALLFAALVGINVFTAVPSMLYRAGESTSGTNLSDKPVLSDNTEGRNVYWLLFDEYSSNYVYDKYYNFDNSPFTDWLEDQGFFVSYTSENESNKTAAVTANIGNLEYKAYYSDFSTLSADWEFIIEYRKKAKLVPVFEEHGYTVVGIGAADYYGYTGEKAASALADGTTVEGQDTVDLFWEKTVAAPFMRANFTENALVLLEQMQYLQNPRNIPEGHTFVLLHIFCPHAPYLFAADGSLLPSGASQDNSFYLGQSQFVTTQMKAMVENIIQNDPTAIIALMSDHGERDNVLDDDQRRIFASLYNGGAENKIDIEGMSGMNIMITMMNEALGTEIEYRDMPVFEEVTTH